MSTRCKTPDQQEKYLHLRLPASIAAAMFDALSDSIAIGQDERTDTSREANDKHAAQWLIRRAYIAAGLKDPLKEGIA